MKERSVDVAVIGAGTAGMAAFRRVLGHTDKAVLIEGDRYGTTCARVGCMPSKLLIAAAEAAHAARTAAGFGVRVEGLHVDGRAVMQRLRRERDRFVGFVVEAAEAWPQEQRVMGRARFLDDHTLAIEDQGAEIERVSAARIVIATGSRTVCPKPFTAAGDRLITSDDVFDWQDLPDSVAVFGGGAIGLELGQALHRLGVRVRLFGKGGDVGILSDPEVRQAALAALAGDPPFLPDADVQSIARDGDAVSVAFDENGETRAERFAWLLAATGRKPNVDGLGLERTSLELDDQGVPRFDRFTLQCGQSHVFIAGDADNDRPILHEAADEGKIAGDNAGRFPEVLVGQRSSAMGIVFTEPNLATVGRTFAALEAGGRAFATGAVDFESQGRSRVMQRNAGLLRVYGEPGTGLFLGAEMAGPRAEHLAHLLAWAHQQRLTVPEMLELPFYHPVVEEGLRTALRNLNRQLRLGPEPVKLCLDCGPGG